MTRRRIHRRHGNARAWRRAACQTCAMTAMAVIAWTLAPLARAHAGTWVQTGPEGGIVRTVALDPSDADVVYAGTETGVFKSVNGGVD